MRKKIWIHKLYGFLGVNRSPLMAGAWIAVAICAVETLLQPAKTFLWFTALYIALALVVCAVMYFRTKTTRVSRNRALLTLAYLTLPITVLSALIALAAAKNMIATLLLLVLTAAVSLIFIFLARNVWRRNVRIEHVPGLPKYRHAISGRSVLSAFGCLGSAIILFFISSLVPEHFIIRSVVVIAVVIAIIIAVNPLRYAIYLRKQHHALETFEPVFAIFHDGLSQLHWDMWVPYLRKSGVPLLQVATREKNFQIRSENKPYPIILGDPAGSEVEFLKCFPQSIKAIFYPRNAKINSLLIENFPDKTHVFLHHGDGDKPASSNKTAGRHDVLVVAGQAAIDRYALRGVEIPREKFRILGRPIAGNFEEQGSGSANQANQENSRVLYAPTWKGLNEKANFSSLEFGPAMVKHLLSRGLTVIFRPHPSGQHYPPHRDAIKQIKNLLAADKQANGRNHIWGAEAEKNRTLADVANLSDLMIADVSGTITDYMQTLKPFIMVSTKMPAEEFVETFPSAQSAYIVESNNISTLEVALDQALGEDPLQEKRRERRGYYLGGFSGNESAQAFVNFLQELTLE